MDKFAEGEAQCRAEAERLKNKPLSISKWLAGILSPAAARRMGEPQWWHPLVDSYRRNESEIYRNSREFIQEQLNDYIWFGVDAYGFIAMFFPDGTGPIPCKLKILPPHLRMGSAPPPLPRPARPPEYQNLKYPDV